MKIGGGWTRKSDKGKTFISIALDEAFKKLCPCFESCNLMLSYVEPQDRTNEKAPGWTVNLIADSKKEDADKKKKAQEAEQEILTENTQASTTSTSSADALNSVKPIQGGGGETQQDLFMEDEILI